MFAKATRKLLSQIDPDGILIPVTRLNDSDKLLPLAVVLKRKPVWFWQSPKYTPTDFTLSSLLKGKPIRPELTDHDFVKGEVRCRHKVIGSVEARVSRLTLDVVGQGHSQLHLTFGKLQKEDVEIESLLKDTKQRVVNLQHSLIQQVNGKQAFTILKERIISKDQFTITRTQQAQGGCGAMLRWIGARPLNMCVKESHALELDSEVSLDIPSQTVIAYSVIKLHIDMNNGQFKLYTQHDITEVDSSAPGIQEDSITTLKKVLAEVNGVLCELAALSAQSRSSMLQLLRQILADRPALSALEEWLYNMVQGLSFDLNQSELADAQKQNITSFVNLLQSGGTSASEISPLVSENGHRAPAGQTAVHLEPTHKNGQPRASEPLTGSAATSHGVSAMPPADRNGSLLKAANQSHGLFTAVHMLVSSMDGLTDDGLFLLESCCSPDLLNGLNGLVNHLIHDAQPLPMANLPNPLQKGDSFKRVEKLFRSSNMLLRKRTTGLWMETKHEAGFLPVVLCNSIQGLAYLSMMEE